MACGNRRDRQHGFLSRFGAIPVPVVSVGGLAGALKQEAVLALLSRPNGTTVTAIMEATGWQTRHFHPPFWDRE
jgi:hypothetical protein